MGTLTRSKQDYLKALYALSANGATITTSSLAARLQVSAPSVTNMLGRLAQEKLVSHTPRAGARLTARGRRAAIEMVRRHRILETFLVRVLGLDWSEVHEDADILEHHISDRVLEAIDRLIGHPVEDPHGHLIPDRDGKLAQRALQPLVTLPRGAFATVREIHDTDHALMLRWKELGLVPGARVRMTDVRAVEGVFELEVDGHPFVCGSQGLDGVMVQTLGGSTA